jgi:hypothetical protein
MEIGLRVQWPFQILSWQTTLSCKKHGQWPTFFINWFLLALEGHASRCHCSDFASASTLHLLPFTIVLAHHFFSFICSKMAVQYKSMKMAEMTTIIHSCGPLFWRALLVTWETSDNFRMNTHYGRYGAAYNMVGLRCFKEELSLLPKNPTEAKLQATSTRGESTEPT